jgi:excisionase family DNA binding protein
MSDSPNSPSSSTPTSPDTAFPFVVYSLPSGTESPSGAAAQSSGESDPGATSQQEDPDLDDRIEAIVERLVQDRLKALMASQAPDPLWDVDEVAAYLGVSRRTVDTLIASGEIKPMRVGRQRRFHRKSIDAYLRSTIH